MSLIHIARNNAVLGQFSAEEVRDGLAQGKFLLTDLAWQTGMSEWQTLSQWPEFGTGAAAIAGATPIPAPAIPTPPPAPEWERRREVGRLRAFFGTIKDVVFDPMRTFSAMPTSGGLRSPLGFYTISQVIQALCYSVCTALMFVFFAYMIQQGSASGTTQDPAIEKLLEHLPAWVLSVTGAVAGGIGYFILMLLWIPVCFFISAGILHVCLLITGATKKPFEITARSVAYVGGAFSLLQLPLAILGAIPLIGILFSFVSIALVVWGAIVLGIALVKAHQAEVSRVVFAILIPLLFCCITFVLLFVAMFLPLMMKVTNTTH